MKVEKYLIDDRREVRLCSGHAKAARAAGIVLIALTGRDCVDPSMAGSRTDGCCEGMSLGVGGPKHRAPVAKSKENDEGAFFDDETLKAWITDSIGTTDDARKMFVGVIENELAKMHAGDPESYAGLDRAVAIERSERMLGVLKAMIRTNSGES